MAGKTESMIKRLEREMAAAAEALEYEKAARLRDDLGALRRALEKQAVVLGDGTDADVVAFAQDELEAAVQVFHVRGGRVRGQRGWIVDKVEAVTTGELVEQFLLQVYGGVDEQTGVGEAGEAVPREVLVPELPEDADVYTELLEELRGGKVSLRVPQRGDKRSLMETVERNAKEAFARHRVKRASDLTARSLALSELQEALELPDAPLRIECIDVSHVQGTNVVASMVVFEDGLAKKSDYRRFSVTHGTDDTAAMAEVVRRRFARHLKEEADRRDEQGIAAEEGRPRRFAYPPNLLVVDGGAPQVAAASRSLDRTRHRRRRRLRAGQAHGGGVAAGRQRPGDPAAHLRGAVPAPAGPGRGPPVRHHLSPAEAVDQHAGVAAGRRPRSRGVATKGADEAVRIPQAAACRHGRGAHGRARASAGGRRRRCRPRSPSRPIRRGRRHRPTESTTAPQGPAERGTPRAGTGETAEVGRVAS